LFFGNKIIRQFRQHPGGRCDLGWSSAGRQQRLPIPTLVPGIRRMGQRMGTFAISVGEQELFGAGDMGSAWLVLRAEPLRYVQHWNVGPYTYGSRESHSTQGYYAVAPKRTDTSFETPGSCIVTPYSTGAMLIVFLLWVISTNCVCTDISCTNSVKRAMF